VRQHEALQRVFHLDRRMKLQRGASSFHK
jgi:hypothetical protein